MISSLNSADAFKVEGNQPLNADASCSACIRSGHTYVYNNDQNSKAMVFDDAQREQNNLYFAELNLGEDYNGRCCRKLPGGQYDCDSDIIELENLFWETLQFDKLAGSDFGPFVPRMRQMVNYISGQGDVDFYDTFVGTPGGLDDADGQVILTALF